MECFKPLSCAVMLFLMLACKKLWQEVRLSKKESNMHSQHTYRNKVCNIPLGYAWNTIRRNEKAPFVLLYYLRFKHIHNILIYTHSTQKLKSYRNMKPGASALSISLYTMLS
jgi:hypothetical protein